MSAGGSSTVTINLGDPLVLRVSLIDYPAIYEAIRGGNPGPPLQIGSARRPVIEGIRVGGAGGSTWRLRPSVLGDPAPNPVAILDSARSWFADLSFDAAKLAKLPAGTYRVMATMPAPGSKSLLESEAVSVKVTGKSVRRRGKRASAYFVYQAWYARRRGHYALAGTLAHQAAVLGPSNINALLLQGDLAARRKLYLVALDFYSRALAALQPAKMQERPIGLEDRISDMRIRLGMKP
jgi:hypothetical protein